MGIVLHICIIFYVFQYSSVNTFLLHLFYVFSLYANISNACISATLDPSPCMAFLFVLNYS